MSSQERYQGQHRDFVERPDPDGREKADALPLTVYRDDECDPDTDADVEEK